MTPLVTIGVVTYNSEETILDTLTSIINLDYSNIELIISDDASNDRTLPICQTWIKSNAKQFANVTLLTVEKNTGVTKNCNRVLHNAHGEWLRIIAGDDVFFPNAIKDYLLFAEKFPQAEWILSKHHMYNNTFDESNYIKEADQPFNNSDWLAIFNLDARNQLKYMVRRNFAISPSSIWKTNTILRIGGFIEKYPSLEDYPMNLLLLINGVKCYFCDSYTLGYRRGNNNVCASNVKLFNLKYIKSRLAVQKDFCYSYYPWRRKVYEQLNYVECVIFEKLRMNNAKSAFCRFSFNTIHKILKLLFWFAPERY